MVETIATGVSVGDVMDEGKKKKPIMRSVQTVMVTIRITVKILVQDVRVRDTVFVVHVTGQSMYNVLAAKGLANLLVHTVKEKVKKSARIVNNVRRSEKSERPNRRRKKNRDAPKRKEKDVKHGNGESKKSAAEEWKRKKGPRNERSGEKQLRDVVVYW